MLDQQISMLQAQGCSTCTKQTAEDMQRVVWPTSKSVVPWGRKCQEDKAASSQELGSNVPPCKCKLPSGKVAASLVTHGMPGPNCWLSCGCCGCTMQHVWRVWAQAQHAAKTANSMQLQMGNINNV